MKAKTELPIENVTTDENKEIRRKTQDLLTQTDMIKMVELPRVMYFFGL